MRDGHKRYVSNKPPRNWAAFYLLTAGELELGAAEGLDNSGLVLVRRADAHDGLADVNASHSSKGFAKSTSHSSLEPDDNGHLDNFRTSHKNVGKNYLSAPAQLNILLMRMTWKGWTLIRMWKASLPQFFTKY